MWLKRLKEAGEPWVNTWTSHQTRDEFWKHASICEDYSKVTEARQLRIEILYFSGDLQSLSKVRSLKDIGNKN